MIFNFSVFEIRADPVNGGYVVASTAWSDRCPDDDQVVAKNVKEFLTILEDFGTFYKLLKQSLKKLTNI